MLSPQIKECQSCGNLKSLLLQIDCSLHNFSRNKLNNENYNVETFYCSDTTTALAHYKRVLSRKIYNPTYLCGVDNQDLILQVTRLLFGTCPQCITCDSDTTSTTTLTSSTTFTTSTTTTSTTNME